MSQKKLFEPITEKVKIAQKKAYFAHQRNRRGRQVSYVLATAYKEIVVERLFAGKSQLTTALQPLIEAAEQTLVLDEAKRQRTILRLDAGGGRRASLPRLHSGGDFSSLNH